MVERRGKRGANIMEEEDAIMRIKMSYYVIQLFHAMLNNINRMTQQRKNSNPVIL